jgi:hypothetical protein
MSASTSLDERWRLLLPPNTVVVKASTATDGAIKAQLTALPRSMRVAIVGGRAVRKIARRYGVTIEREYIALPSLKQPVAITLVAPGSLRWFTQAVLTVPSGTVRFHALKWAAIRVMRWRPGLLVRAPVGDRIVIGVLR